jgi:hypothetical protein
MDNTTMVRKFVLLVLQSAIAKHAKLLLVSFNAQLVTQITL